MTEVAKVIATDQENCTLRIERKSACEKCKMCAFPNDAKHIDIKVKNSQNCKVGDNVVVETKNSVVLIASLLVYVLPLCVLTLFLILATFLFDNEIWQFAFCMLGVVIGFVMCFLIAKHSKLKKSIKFEITKVLQKKEQEK